MASIKVPVTISELLASVTKTTGNIAQHRAAMAQVAAQAKVPVPPQAKAGGESK